MRKTCLASRVANCWPAKLFKFKFKDHLKNISNYVARNAIKSILRHCDRLTKRVPELLIMQLYFNSAISMTNKSNLKYLRNLARISDCPWNHLRPLTNCVIAFCQQNYQPNDNTCRDSTKCTARM